MKLVQIKKLCNLFLDIAIKQIEKSELVLPVAYFLTKNKEVIFSPLIGLLEEDHVNEFLMTTTNEHHALCGLYIMLQCEITPEKINYNFKDKDGPILLHCEYPDGKFELLQEYNIGEDGKLVFGERRFSDTDFIGKFSGYFEESNKPIDWAA
jgi:hypothetical protein